MKTKSLPLALIIVLVFFSCKKGEDDPAFTPSSRTNRLKGNWVLKSANLQGTYTNAREGFSDFVFISDGAKFTLDFADTTKTIEGAHRLLLHFDKDGKMEVRETFFSEGYYLTGTWDFLHKGGDSKNKERIMLVPGEVINGSTSDFHALFFPSIERVFLIRELRKDKLVLVYEGKPYIQQGGETLSLKGEFLFGR